MLKDLTEIDYIKEYLKANGYKSTLECLEKEEKYIEADIKANKVNKNSFIKYFLKYLENTVST